jgi:hypothetical protein
MLNKRGERELAYLVKIDDIQPIVGSDNCESAVVGAWHIMVRKGTFSAGDVAIYFEIDSLLDTTKPEFSFMEKYHGRVKTQRYTFGGKGNFISQGLLMHPGDFGWVTVTNESGDREGVMLASGAIRTVDTEARFLTEELGVKYYDPEDEKRKKDPKPKQPELPKFFYVGIGRKMMKVKWLKNIIIKVFGKKKRVASWPYWVVKTDEERVQNIPWIIKEEDEWVQTEKIDGSSATFTMIKHKRKFDYYVCSRNVVFETGKEKCYYDTNIYLEMSEKYGIKDFLERYLKAHKDIEWATIQGEIYGPGVQKRDYSKQEKNLAVFNFIDSKNGRWNSSLANLMLVLHNIPFVPILDSNFKMPDTVDELLEMANGNSVLDGKPREGFVFRSRDGIKSFKVVSNEYLLKYHS